jgi:hypothetical protein
MVHRTLFSRTCTHCWKVQVQNIYIRGIANLAQDAAHADCVTVWEHGAYSVVTYDGRVFASYGWGPISGLCLKELEAVRLIDQESNT